MRRVQWWPCVAIILAALLCSIRAQESAPSPMSIPAMADEETESEWPSPNGRFAFATNYESNLHTIDLIDAKSKKVLQRIGEEDSEMVHYHVLWAPDSKRFALMTRYGHPAQGLTVYGRSGETFREIESPELPEANIPERLKHGKSFPHVANMNWTGAKTWKKDGSLVIGATTMIDGGEDGSITAERTVVLEFDRSGKARIVRSTIKHETAKD